MTTDTDVRADYLARLQREATGHLAPDRARELVDDIAEHLTEAERAGGDLGVRTAIDRLGEPRDIVEAASGTWGVPETSVGTPSAPAQPDTRRDWAALICLCLSLPLSILPPVAVVVLVVGVVMLLMSRRFTVADKVLGMLAGIVGGSPTTFVVMFLAVDRACGGSARVCGNGGLSWVESALAIGLVVAALCFDVYVAVRLIRRLRRQ